MYGYKMKLPKSMPSAVWACKTSVNRYDWKNTNRHGMVELGVCKASLRTVQLGEYEPISVCGKSLSCIIGDCDVRSNAADGVEVEIALHILCV